MKPIANDFTQNAAANEFLQEMCGEIRYKGVHRAIAEEYAQHIEESAQSLIANGSDADSAYEAAVTNMGDPHAIGKELNKTHRPMVDWRLILITAALVIFGVWYNSWTSPVYFVIGLVAFLCAMRFDYRRLECRSVIVFIALMLIPLALQNLAYSHGYIFHKISGRIYPNLVIPMLTLAIVCYSGIVRRFCTGNRRDFIILLVLALIPLYVISSFIHLIYTCVLLAVLILTITGGILQKDFQGNRRNYLLAFWGGLAAMALLIQLDINIFSSKRLLILSPFADTHLENYNAANYIQVLAAGFIKTATAVGRADFGYIDNYYNPSMFNEMLDTDYAFTGVVTKHGWIFGLVLVALLALFIVHMAVSLYGTQDGFGKILVTAILSFFTVEIIYAVLMGLGILPTAAISLPFISYGGSAYICNMILVGLLASVYRRRNILIAEPKGIRKPPLKYTQNVKNS